MRRFLGVWSLVLFIYGARQVEAANDEDHTYSDPIQADTASVPSSLSNLVVRLLPEPSETSQASRSL
ncbi:hypothetical protein CYMTET_28256 [Cymbomonas tetramitiformis]|uniref:Uncharacterized protein n=1 Tax=Cymbomonas tetramitiformis TaxID=36881 RepID=A0AAE0KWE4_9CHLO|nr:hypothetical protein CYMTET_28256 [Cymbomonas tetramitiformis]